MEFGSVVKVPDGRYYLKTSKNNRLVLKGLKKTDLTTKPVQIRLSAKQVDDVRAIEKLIENQARGSSKEWFGREVSESTLEKAFHSSISPDGIMELSLSVNATFWGPDRQQLEDVPGPGTFDLIIDLTGVWFLKKTYGPIFKVVQAKSCARPSECLFVDDEDDDEDFMD